MAKLKIGVVPYMNAKPFIYGFQKIADEVDIVYGVPSTLPQMVENDELDIILMPSVGYFRSEGYKIIPGNSSPQSSCHSVSYPSSSTSAYVF